MPENRGCGCGLFGGDNECLWIIILLIILRSEERRVGKECL